MPRFYLSQPLVVGEHIALPEAIAHHIHVLRLAEGDAVTLFNGEGGQYQATLSALARRSASAVIVSHVATEVELPFAVTLAQALPEASKMDWIIEKAVELGVSAIVPLAAQRCVVRLSAERAEKKLAHWQAVIVAASEQCGRNRLASLAAPLDFNNWLGTPSSSQRIVLSPRASASLADWAKERPAQAVTLIIGPEGGLNDSEEALAQRHGAIALSMGPRVLRTETAALAALSALSAAWGGI